MAGSRVMRRCSREIWQAEMPALRREVAMVAISGAKLVWFTLMPMPAIRAPSAACTMMPAIFFSLSNTSLGQRRSVETRATSLTALCTARPSAMVKAGNTAGRRRMIDK